MVRVECVDRVIHGCDINDVVNAFVLNRDVWQVQRLADDRTVHGLREQFAKVGGVYVCWREKGFLGIGAPTGIVVVPGQDAALAKTIVRTHEKERETEQRFRPRPHESPPCGVCCAVGSVALG